VITFVLVAALLVAVALAWLLPPLLRREAAADTTDRVQVNLAMLRDQLVDLEAEHARGALPPEQYAESKVELERRVLEETASEDRASTASGGAGRMTGALVAAVVPVGAVILYLAFGDPGALDLQRRITSVGDHTKQPTAQDIEVMLTRLAQRLEKEPENADGWAMLARSYYILQRYPEAVRAYEKLVKLVPQEAAVLADYADALAMRDGRKISGRPLEIVHEALKIDPTQAKALAMAGTEAFDRQDFKAAVEYWEKLRASAPVDSEMAQNIEGSIAEARARGKLPGGEASVAAAKPAPAAPAAPTAAAPVAPAAAASVAGTVKLDPTLAARAAPTDTVFVFARASEGPRVPLAVFRLQAKDLPARFLLDDSLAMAPQFRLSNFKNVLVNARISKTGSATPSSGDLEGKGVPVSLGAQNVVVTIDHVVP
jgi:cytochrome c-type biogenesis protein CcmH